MTASRLVKWPTHLAITVDVILGNAESVDNVHKVDSTIYDSEDTAAEAKTHLWSRIPPKEGAYIVTQAPLATSPLRFNINDPENMRLIPEAFDGTNPENEHLPPTIPFISGIGVIKTVQPDRKRGLFGGFVFLNKGLGWVEWEADARFDDSVKFAAWMLPPPRTLVSFDALLAKVSPQGDIQIILRRVTSLDSAPQGLLSALAIGTAGSSDRAARIREVRATKVKRQEAESSDPFTAPPVGDPEKAITDFKLPAITGIVTRAGAAAGPPSSPSPAPKKQRGHVQ
ncbi:hypothetical protein CF319_g8015 [Tilletia indica]|uniref:Uncharacterized protein n=1 Tax=Tilletia indica TaxID=43049 RepID=A0A177T6K2_9BASI|nr:hypothetical protein CF319_g8015 [Tilletia indica]KAE8243818.1 hypothetical protein A4X13_0g6934 [Tilletia indica]